jgi:hypothetical protein
VCGPHEHILPREHVALGGCPPAFFVQLGCHVLWGAHLVVGCALVVKLGEWGGVCADEVYVWGKYIHIYKEREREKENVWASHTLTE